MNLEYFCDKIEDELNDSCDYLKQAMEIKAMTPDWARQLQTMSKNEMEHASMLYKMFNDYYTKLSSTYKVMPEYMEETKKCVDKMYTKKVPKVAALQTAYEKL